MSNIRNTDQFMKDAANLVLENDYSLNATAEASGVCHSAFISWVANIMFVNTNEDFAYMVAVLDFFRARLLAGLSAIVW